MQQINLTAVRPAFMTLLQPPATPAGAGRLPRVDRANHVRTHGIHRRRGEAHPRPPLERA